MLDACPHHHEEEASLEGLSPRSPRTSQGKKFWRSLDELAQTPAFENMLHREFPHAASEWKDEPSRRNFLKLMSASLALGGLSACTMRKTSEKIVPYVNPPEEVIPGRPLFFATSMSWCGYAKGVIVESHEGRPTNIQGNPDHPASLGASDIWMQASVLDLYDPDRSKNLMHGDGNVSTWGTFVETLTPKLAELRRLQGKGLRFLTGTVTSPTIARQIQALLKQMPEVRWHQHEPVGRSNARAGIAAAFGQDVQPVYRFDKADVILSLDANFFTDDPGSVVYARQFIDGRRIRQRSAAKMNRLYVVETSVTMAGAMADHRLALKSAEIESLASRLAKAVAGTPADGKDAQWINALAADLQASKGSSLVIAGESQSPSVHALVCAMNDVLGNVGNTVSYIDPVEAAGPGGPHTLADLMDDASKGAVDVLVVIGTNPAFTAPYEMGLVAGENGDKAAFRSNPFSKITTVIHHGSYFDETAFFSHWHIPASYYLESWGDLRAYDGTASITQPLIYPLYASKSEVELLGFLSGEGDRSAYELIRDTWRSSSSSFEAFWQKAVEKGVIPDSTFGAKRMPLKLSLQSAIAGARSALPAAGLEINFRPDPNVWDGRYANNAWLQELGKPITLLTWDNVALMSLRTAQNLRVQQYDPGKAVEASIVQLKIQGRTLNLPALVLPGHADDAVTVYMGYGRSRAGEVGNGKGGNAYDIRSGAALWYSSGLDVSNTDELYSLATLQSHHLIDSSAFPKLDGTALENRNLYHVYTLDELKTKSGSKTVRTISLPLAKEKETEEPGERLIPTWKYDHPENPTYNKWGMVIDNNACIGCNACVVACQSENNIPIVGKDQVLRGREMHWLRIDTYFEGSPLESPDVYFQPVACMHCETAPCELVCPVEATSHSAEGLNEQTYNRCVGTRYCSNNCPYKVRRFNFLYYSDYQTPSLMLMHNPNVTVRSRGIMEKCTYCVQRINNGRIEAKKLDRKINPGEVVPACAQACPTQAIYFGNLNDSEWEVTKLQEEPLRYSLLDELDTLPRTTYLPRLQNPNPQLNKPASVFDKVEG